MGHHLSTARNNVISWSGPSAAAFYPASVTVSDRTGQDRTGRHWTAGRRKRDTISEPATWPGAVSAPAAKELGPKDSRDGMEKSATTHSWL